MQFNKIYLTKPLRKMFSNLLKLDKLNLVTDASWRKSLYPQRRFPETTEHDVPHLLVKKKEKKRKKYLL